MRCRLALTLSKMLRPIMVKYNVNTDEAVVCIAGTCDPVKIQTPVGVIGQKTLVVMSQQQFSERKSLPRRDYQKELSIIPQWMIAACGTSQSAPDTGFPPFHQHGDVSFCELPLETEGRGGLLRHAGAARTYSSNPRVKFSIRFLYTQIGG